MMHELKTYQASAMVGVCMAGLAIRDAVTILHGGAGCDIQTHSFLGRHNVSGSVHYKVVCTKISDHELVLDPAPVLHRIIADTVAACGAKLVIITAASFVEVAGIDWEGVLEELGKKISVPIIYVKAPDFSSDLFSGYFKAAANIARFFTQDTPGRENDIPGVNIVGYVFDRPEYDHFANFHEIRRYLQTLELRYNCSLFDGGSASALHNLPNAGLNIVFPGAGEAAEVLESNCGHISIHRQFPIGIPLTRDFIMKLASAVDKEKSAREFIAKEENRLIALLKTVEERLADRRIAIFSDSQKIKGLIDVCNQLKIRTVLAGVLDETPPEFLLENASGCEILLSPGYKTISRKIADILKDGPVDFLIGTRKEVEIGERYSIPSLEFGFPCSNHHVLYPMPYLGYNGIAVLATRLLDVMRYR